MRIVLIHQDLFFQGGQYVVAKLANGLARRGHEVHVVVSKVHADIAAAHPEAKPFALDESVAFHVLPFRRAMYNVLPLAVLLRKLNADVVLPNAGHYNQCAVLAKVVSTLSVPLVYVEHNFTGGQLSRLSRFCLKRDAKIVCVSDGVARSVRGATKLPSSRVSRIYNPILDDEFERRRAEEPSSNRLGKGHPFTVVAAGALCSRKGFSCLIEAFRIFHEKVQDSQLLIFGRGEEAAALQRQINDSGLEDAAHLEGFTDNLPANLAHADVFVLSSREETFGVVLVEALACGLKVVSTDAPFGPREILQGGRFGQLVPVDAPQAMADALKQRIEKLKEQGGDALQRRVYNIDSEIDRIENNLGFLANSKNADILMKEFENKIRRLKAQKAEILNEIKLSAKSTENTDNQ